MTPDQYELVCNIFGDALERSPEEWEEYTRTASNGDALVAREVLLMLQEHDPEAARREGERAVEIPSVASEGNQIGPTQVGATAVGLDDRFPSETRIGLDSTKRSAANQRASVETAGTSAATQPSVRRWKNWLPLTMAAVSLLITIPLLLWVDRRLQSDLRSVCLEKLRFKANSVASGIQLWHDRICHNNLVIAEDSAFRDAVAELVDLAQTTSGEAGEGDHSQVRQTLLEAVDQREKLRRIVSRYLQNRSVPVDDDSLRFVIWDRQGLTLASWIPQGTDVGRLTNSRTGSLLARCLESGPTIVGPNRLDSTEGFVPETKRPVMAVLLPVRDQKNQPIAVLLIRGIGLFDDFSRRLMIEQFGATGEVFVVNRAGELLSEPRGSASDLVKFQAPLRNPNTGVPTVPASDFSRPSTQTKYATYNSHHGEAVCGAWKWIDEMKFGVVVEQQESEVFDSLQNLRYWVWPPLVLGLAACVGAAALLARDRKRKPTPESGFERYRIKEELGRGGMGIVYRAQHGQLKRPTALKVIRPDREDNDAMKRFDREVRLAATLRSPHTVSIFDYGWTDDGRAYCAMELLDGLTLQQVVARSGTQPVGRALAIIHQLCDSLAEAHHSGLVHRDIKPQNLMLLHAEKPVTGPFCLTLVWQNPFLPWKECSKRANWFGQARRPLWPPNVFATRKPLINGVTSIRLVGSSTICSQDDNLSGGDCRDDLCDYRERTTIRYRSSSARSRG